MRSNIRLLLVSALAACSLSAFAQKRPHLMPVGVRKDPIAIAKCKIVGINGNQVKLVTGPKIPYHRGYVNVAAQTDIALDEFEFSFDQTGAVIPDENPNYGAACWQLPDPPDTRWYFGDSYTPGLRYNDMKVRSGAAGAVSTRLAYTWFIADDGAGGARQVTNSTHLVVTCENWVKTAADASNAAMRGDLDGVLFFYGPESGPSAGYNYSDVDLAQTPYSFRMPVDGNGGYITAHGDYNDGTQTLVLGCAQDMVWGLKSGNPNGPEDPDQWDDDFPTNGLFDDQGELYSYDFTGQFCPDVEGAMMLFFYTASPPETLAPNAQQVVLGQIASGNLASLAADDNNAERMCRFILPNRSSPFVVTNLTYTTSKTTLTSVSFKVKAKMSLIGQFAIKLGLKDQTQSNVFDVVLPETSIGTAYTVFTGNASGNLQKYRGSGGAMVGQISVRNTGPVPGSGNWCTDFEYAQLTVGGS
ncbi:MAG: hypothetical protein JSS66_01925 [Armatimonadetes bacterium]|nr:hypothetical protein [Armatimonadota bacterium]